MPRPSVALRRPLLFLWGASLIAVIVLTLTPGLGPPSRFGLDKAAHFAAYAWLAMLGWLTLTANGTGDGTGRDRRLRRVRLRWVLIAGLVLLAAGSEAAQFLIDSRHARLSDGAANGAGVAVGLGVGRWLTRLRPLGTGPTQKALR